MNQQAALRERLIDAGVDLVLTEGSASVGLREIARRAGVSHGAPRRYFPTHAALLSAVARRGFADLGARFEAAAAGTTAPRGRLHAVAHAYVRYALERRGMFELMFRQDLLDSAASASELPRLRESALPLFEHIVELVAQCRSEASDEAAPAPAVTAAALWSNLHGIAQLWTWGSLQVALGAVPLESRSGDPRCDELITAALDAHVGPERS
ncbi:TetR/AcrR family transcriptional regulator [Streptomyces sp. TRM66268-LWL]|uniref:TetR/AcrR family transcriptional regulator n=1 Tax=Streptomyces polyasparticus TaxID=2767826 RepID=A0ABR7SK72_9ACTN|nr:TetR/AcrR family transcriptional regulator [Streptomyces polyasparticus]MBC9714733.1 TetR/AcrR family transcriptional regulator [Streptomyces polyasparticus]